MRSVGFILKWLIFVLAGSLAPPDLNADETGVRDIGSRLELFVDRYLIDRLEGALLKLHEPQPAEVVLTFEGAYGGYSTIIKDGQTYRMYYSLRDAIIPESGRDKIVLMFTGYAESSDGVHWTKPDLGLFEVRGTRHNNVVLAGESRVSDTFSPFLDTRPGVPVSERFKALGGWFNKLGGFSDGGLTALISSDGFHWKKLRDKPVINHSQYPFYTDTDQPAAFWSESEGFYLCYLRIRMGSNLQPPNDFHDGYRWIGRTTSKDFINWSKVVPMDVGQAPVEEFYHNQTHPYFRAPHIYVGLPTRFMGAPLNPGRQALTEAQLRKLFADYRLDASGYASNIGIDLVDTAFLTSRGGNRYDRTFAEGFIRPGIGVENWTNRANYSVLGIVPTSPHEMSLYMKRHSLLPSNHIRRYTLRTDGFISVNAPYAGGEMVTKAFTFSGKELVINYSTSAPGSIRVEVQDDLGQPMAGYSLTEAFEIIGDQIERVVSWKQGSDMSKLAGKPIRLRFVMRDADLYSIRFK